MSVSPSVIAQPGSHPFDQLPDDVVRSIFEFLTTEHGSLSVDHLFLRRASNRNIRPDDIKVDDRTVVATSAVCRNWRDHAALKTIRQEASTRLQQRVNLNKMHQEIQRMNEYPPEMVRVFQNSRTPILQLPVLNLAGRGGGDYIDFIQPADMSHPVMRFTDQHGRPGIAFKIHASERICLQARLARIREIASHVRDNLRQGNLPSLCSLVRVTAQTAVRMFRRDDAHDVVLALFKRYTNPESEIWSYGWGNSDLFIERLYNERHNNDDHVGPRLMACPNCPFVDGIVHTTVVSRLLEETDPDFSLLGHNGARPEDQAGVRSSGMSQRTIVVTALVALMIAYLVNNYGSER